MNFDPISEAKKIGDLIISWRRDFHMHPELGYEEERTSKIVEEHLREWGYSIKHVGTGIIADIGEGEKTIASGQIWTPCPFRRRTTFLTSQEFPARCTPAATTPTPLCYSGQRR